MFVCLNFQQFTAYITVVLPSLILFVLGKSFQRGFYCDDESIKHPYKTNTIPTWAASFVGLSLPVLFVS